MLPFRCIYVLLMGFVPSFATIGSCRLHSVSLKQGIYCPADGRRALNLLSYQCRYTCIHSSHCTAINYNNTNGICSLIASPCPVALSDPTLEFVLFVPLVADSQCYEWRPIEWNSWDRAVKLKDTQYVARILRSGSHYVGRWSQIRKKCFARDGDVVFKALKNELNCQSLWIKDGCTSYLHPYTLGNAVPKRAVTGGFMPDGVITFVAFYEGDNGLFRLDYYIQGQTYVQGTHEKSTGPAYILAILWIGNETVNCEFYRFNFKLSQIIW